MQRQVIIEHQKCLNLYPCSSDFIRVQMPFNLSTKKLANRHSLV